MKLTINGASYYIEQHGQGQALLLLHGFSGNHEQWFPFIESWSQHAQLILIDLLGHGLTDAPSEYDRYSSEHTVSDIVAILDHLQVESAILLGYSMGGRIALSMANLASSRVAGLILESTSPGLSTSEERIARVTSDEALAARIEERGIDWFADYWAELPLFASLKQLSTKEQLLIDQQRRSNSPLGLANSLRGIGTGAQPSWWDTLPTITQPVLLIVGEQDEKFRHIATMMMSQMRHAELQLELVSEAGHNVHMEQPNKFDTIVKRYLITRKGMV